MEKKKMTRVERGNTLESAIRQLGDARHYGEETFLNRRDIVERTGTKVLSGVERRLKRQAKGTPLGRLGNKNSLFLAGNDPVRDLFHTKHTTPLYDDGLGDDDDFNVSLVVNRQVNELAPSFEPIKPNTLVLLYKINEGNLNTCRLDGEAFTIQCNALSIIPVSVYNYATGLVQQREARAFPAEYRKRVPSDYWKDYSFDGIPESVQPMQNRASIFSCGGSMVDATAISTTPQCTSLATMAARAVISVENYWGSAVKPGAHVYVVIKKFEPSDYSYDYMSGNKMLVNHSAKKLALAAANDSTISLLRPYQMAFFSLPDGGPVPIEYSRYYDEEGVLRTDGLVMQIGVVTEVPLGHVFREQATRLRPFTGTIPSCPLSQYSDYSRSTTHQPHIKIILKPDDGVMPL